MKYSGYFIRNPFDMLGGDSQYKIEFADVHNCNKFMARINILSQPFI